MSKLREQLERAKADYESARYPGDLAKDLGLDRPARSPWRILMPLVPYGLAASVILGFVLLWPRNPDTNTPERVAIKPPTTVVVPAEDSSVAIVMPEAEAIPELPTFPTDVPAMPSMDTETYSSFPAVPSMPSWSESDSTAKEQT